MMQSQSDADSRSHAERFFWALTGRPRLALLTSLLLVVVGAAGLPRLQRDPGAEAFIPANHPAVVYRDKTEEIFGLADPMVVVVLHDGEHGVFNPDTLNLVDWLSEEISDLSAVNADRVTSLATENDIVGTVDGMRVDPFFEYPPTSQAEADAIREAALGFDLYVDSLVAADGGATLIVAELENEEGGEEVYTEILALLERAPRNGEAIHVAGEGAVEAKLGAYIDADARRLNPISAVVITFILFIAYRTWRGVLLPNLVVLGAVGFALGAMAWANYPIYVITNSLPPLLIAIAVADGIHILGQYYEELALRPRASQRELVTSAMVHMWRPVTVTSFTDIGGFLAIAFASFMPPMRAFGVFASVGVLMALVLSLLTLPAALMWLAPRHSPAFPALTGKRLQRDWFGRLMNRLGRPVLRRPGWILAACAVVTLAGAVGALTLRIDESRISVFNDDEPIFIADAAINQNLSGTNYLDVVIEARDHGGILEPAHLEKIEALQRFVETQPHVASTTSVVDYVKQMHRAVNEDRDEMYAIPDSADLVAQYFLLYEASGDPSDFEDVVDYDYRLAHLRAAMDDGYYSSTRAAVEATADYLNAQFNTAGIQGSLAGRINVDYHWIRELAQSHFRGVALALIAIWLITSASFRSFTAGLFATLPVAMAVLLLYAVMGLSGVSLGVGTTMFAAIGIGTGVDFAVHTLDRLLASVRGRGLSIEDAIMDLYPSTGRALLFSFLALFLGFGVLTTSYVPPLVKFGTLVGIAVGVAFATSLTALPALALVLRPRFLEPKNHTGALK